MLVYMEAIINKYLASLRNAVHRSSESGKHRAVLAQVGRKAATGANWAQALATFGQKWRKRSMRTPLEQTRANPVEACPCMREKHASVYAYRRGQKGKSNTSGVITRSSLVVIAVRLVCSML